MSELIIGTHVHIDSPGDRLHNCDGVVTEIRPGSHWPYRVVTTSPIPREGVYRSDELVTSEQFQKIQRVFNNIRSSSSFPPATTAAPVPPAVAATPTTRKEGSK